MHVRAASCSMREAPPPLAPMVAGRMTPPRSPSFRPSTPVRKPSSPMGSPVLRPSIPRSGLSASTGMLPRLPRAASLGPGAHIYIPHPSAPLCTSLRTSAHLTAPSRHRTPPFTSSHPAFSVTAPHQRDPLPRCHRRHRIAPPLRHRPRCPNPHILPGEISRPPGPISPDEVGHPGISHASSARAPAHLLPIPARQLKPLHLGQLLPWDLLPPAAQRPDRRWGAGASGRRPGGTPRHRPTQ